MFSHEVITVQCFLGCQLRQKEQRLKKNRGLYEKDLHPNLNSTKSVRNVFFKYIYRSLKIIRIFTNKHPQSRTDPVD